MRRNGRDVVLLTNPPEGRNMKHRKHRSRSNPPVNEGKLLPRLGASSLAAVVGGLAAAGVAYGITKIPQVNSAMKSELALGVAGAALAVGATMLKQERAGIAIAGATAAMVGGSVAHRTILAPAQAAQQPATSTTSETQTADARGWALPDGARIRQQTYGYAGAAR